MKRLMRHRPSPAMVIACIALGIALTGTSVAAVTALAPNSVGTAQIKPNAGTAAKIQNANVIARPSTLRPYGRRCHATVPPSCRECHGGGTDGPTPVRATPCNRGRRA